MMPGMQPLRTVFSPSGRLSPQIFIVLIVLVYLAGAVSHALTVPDVITRTGLWPFVAAQALLIWIWYALHAKRLRDGGRATGLAVSIEADGDAIVVAARAMPGFAAPSPAAPPSV